MGRTKTLYISDLDGTLLNTDAELSGYATDRLNALIQNGLCFSVATARTFASAGHLISGLPLSIPVVLMNGVLVYDIGEKNFLQVHTIPPKTVAAVIGTLKMFNATGFMYELKGEKFMTYYESLESKPLRDFVEERVVRFNKRFEHTADFAYVPRDGIIYLTLYDLPEKLRPVHDALAAMPGLNLTMYKDNYTPDLWFLEIFNEKASKQNALAFLRERYGFGRIIGFGDNLNDLPMFKECDVSVAVENANEEVKAAADYICGANYDDGVVKWIEQDVLGLAGAPGTTETPETPGVPGVPGTPGTPGASAIAACKED